MFTAAGVLSALDIRESPDSPLAGLLQSTSYIAGVSGGSWLVSSLLLYDFIPVRTQLSRHWNHTDPILEGVPNFDVRDSIETGSISSTSFAKFSDMNIDNKSVAAVLQYYREIHLKIRSKKFRGSLLSLTDYWGQAIADKIFPKYTTDKLATFTDVTTKIPSFVNHDQPFPLLLASGSRDKNIYEFNPFEFGTWLQGTQQTLFVKVKYLGSSIKNGSVKRCMRNYDNLAFITAASSSLFNNVVIYIWKLAQKSETKIYAAIKSILSAFGINLDKLDVNGASNYSDYAIISPNPFLGFQNESNLFLSDGGENGENLPLDPFLHRDVDVVIAIDSSNDLNNFPNGTALRSTYLRNTNAFPQIPSQEQFLKDDLHKTAKFFGCFTAIQTSPVIVYLPNSYQTFPSNTSTFKLTYTEAELHEMILNGYNLATGKNSTSFCQCVGCAILQRRFKDSVISSFCSDCFSRYCYN